MEGVSRKKKMACLNAGISAGELAKRVKEKEPLPVTFSPEEIALLCDRQKLDVAKREWEQIQKENIALIRYGREGYPKRLLDIPDPPYALYLKGSMPNRSKCVAIVGSRMCTEYGRKIAAKLGQICANAGSDVVSGMALGIDSAAHAGALRAGHPTYAVLGCGCDRCYPASARPMYEEMTGEKGGVISEYPPGSKPVGWHFPERNRIISGLCDILIVAEAKIRSGSLITADCALEQGRDVYAVPGRVSDIHSAGTNGLISQGAGILYDLDLFEEELRALCGSAAAKASGAEPVSKNGLEKEDLVVYSCLDLSTKNLFDLIEETQYPVTQVLDSLERLKRRGLVEEDRQNLFSLK